MSVVAGFSWTTTGSVSPARSVIFASDAISPTRQNALIIRVAYRAPSNNGHPAVTGRVVHLTNCVDGASCVRVVA